MVGIGSFGMYVPLWRLPLNLISPDLRGEKSVAGEDEDSVTMGVGAALECVKGMDPRDVDGLIFATTTAPYAEKQLATMIAAALDLREDVFTVDVTGSLKAGTSALIMALNAVEGGSVRNMLVVAADCRTASPGSFMERSLGDGAAAVMVSNQNLLAEFEKSFSVANEMMDVWRHSKQGFVQAWEDRFCVGQGYQKVMLRVIKGLMDKQALNASDYDRLAIYAPDMRSHLHIGKKLGFDPNTQMQDPNFLRMGNIGTPQPLLLMSEALRSTGENERIVVGGYGGGGDALCFRATSNIENAQGRRGLEAHLKTKRQIANYVTYLKDRGLVEQDPPKSEFGSTAASATAVWRERDQIFGLIGAKCQSCGTVQFPPQRVCTQCHNKDQFDPIRLAEKTGKLFTYSRDAITENIMGMVDLEGGGRMFGSLTDCSFDELEVGMPVQMQFRKTFYDGEKQNYFWKISPQRFEEKG
jgi:hydroxymethylglutaryl-CoA synthase